MGNRKGSKRVRVINQEITKKGKKNLGLTYIVKVL